MMALVPLLENKMKVKGNKLVDDNGKEIRDEDLCEKLAGPVRAMQEILKKDPELAKRIDGYRLRAAFGS
jgi:hypothetical protein